MMPMNLEKNLLTIDKAKEFFILNECRFDIRKEKSGTNYELFNSFNINKLKLNEWINEYIFMVIHDQEWSKDKYDMLNRVLVHGNEIDEENIVFLFDAYDTNKSRFNNKEKLIILLNNFEESDSFVGLVDIITKTDFEIFKREAINFLDELKKRIDSDDRYKKEIGLKIEERIKLIESSL